LYIKSDHSYTATSDVNQVGMLLFIVVFLSLSTLSLMFKFCQAGGTQRCELKLDATKDLPM
jgi:hypothetical protein